MIYAIRYAALDDFHIFMSYLYGMPILTHYHFIIV